MIPDYQGLRLWYFTSFLISVKITIANKQRMTRRALTLARWAWIMSNWGWSQSSLNSRYWRGPFPKYRQDEEPSHCVRLGWSWEIELKSKAKAMTNQVKRALLIYRRTYHQNYFRRWHGPFKKLEIMALRWHLRVLLLLTIKFSFGSYKHQFTRHHLHRAYFVLESITALQADLIYNYHPDWRYPMPPSCQPRLWIWSVNGSYST
jgi:hypothetical protein